MDEIKKKSPIFVTGRRGVSRVRVFKHRKTERYVQEWYVKVPGLRRPKPVTRSLGEMRLTEAKKAAEQKADEPYKQHLKGETAVGLRERTRSASAGSAPSDGGAAAKRSSAPDMTRPFTLDFLMELFIHARTRAGMIWPLYHCVRARLNAALYGARLLVEELDEQTIVEYVHSRRTGGIVIPKFHAHAAASTTRELVLLG